MAMKKAGRNDPCPCGSGRKFKKCCEADTPGARNGTFWMVVVALAVVGSLAAAVASFRTGGSGGGRVWSPEHGHYHDASGVELP